MSAFGTSKVIFVHRHNVRGFYTCRVCPLQPNVKMKITTRRWRKRYRMKWVTRPVPFVWVFGILVLMMFVCVSQDENDVYILTKVSDILHSIFSSYRENILPWFEQLMQLIVNLIVSVTPPTFRFSQRCLKTTPYTLHSAAFKRTAIVLWCLKPECSHSIQ